MAVGERDGERDRVGGLGVSDRVGALRVRYCERVALTVGEWAEGVGVAVERVGDGDGVKLELGGEGVRLSVDAVGVATRLTEGVGGVRLTERVVVRVWVWVLAVREAVGGEAVRVKVGVGLRRRLEVIVRVVVGEGETSSVGDREAVGGVKEALKVWVGGVRLRVGVRRREPEKVPLEVKVEEGVPDPGDGVGVRGRVGEVVRVPREAEGEREYVVGVEVWVRVFPVRDWVTVAVTERDVAVAESDGEREADRERDGVGAQDRECDALGLYEREGEGEELAEGEREGVAAAEREWELLGLKERVKDPEGLRDPGLAVSVHGSVALGAVADTEEKVVVMEAVGVGVFVRVPRKLGGLVQVSVRVALPEQLRVAVATSDRVSEGVGVALRLPLAVAVS